MNGKTQPEIFDLRDVIPSASSGSGRNEIAMDRVDGRTLRKEMPLNGNAVDIMAKVSAEVGVAIENDAIVVQSEGCTVRLTITTGRKGAMVTQTARIDVSHPEGRELPPKVLQEVVRMRAALLRTQFTILDRSVRPVVPTNGNNSALPTASPMEATAQIAQPPAHNSAIPPWLRRIIGA